MEMLLFSSFSQSPCFAAKHNLQPLCLRLSCFFKSQVVKFSLFMIATFSFFVSSFALLVKIILYSFSFFHAEMMFPLRSFSFGLKTSLDFPAVLSRPVIMMKQYIPHPTLFIFICRHKLPP